MKSYLLIIIALLCSSTSIAHSLPRLDFVYPNLHQKIAQELAKDKHRDLKRELCEGKEFTSCISSEVLDVWIEWEVNGHDSSLYTARKMPQLYKEYKTLIEKSFVGNRDKLQAIFTIVKKDLIKFIELGVDKNRRSAASNFVNSINLEVEDYNSYDAVFKLDEKKITMGLGLTMFKSVSVDFLYFALTHELAHSLNTCFLDEQGDPRDFMNPFHNQSYIIPGVLNQLVSNFSIRHNFGDDEYLKTSDLKENYMLCDSQLDEVLADWFAANVFKQNFEKRVLSTKNILSAMDSIFLNLGSVYRAHFNSTERKALFLDIFRNTPFK